MDEWVDLGEAELAWGGYEILSSRSHCRVSRRVRDGALFAEIWVPGPECEPQTYQYIGPVRLPNHG